MVKLPRGLEPRNIQSQCILKCMEFLVSIHGEGMGISSLLVMTTLGLDTYIGNLMPWIHSLNLRRDWITYLVYIPNHFDQIKVIYPVSLNFSVAIQDYFPIMCTRISIAKWRGGKKISNLDEHSEIVDRFLIFSQILLGICLIDYVIHFFFLRGISFYRISKRIFGLFPLQLGSQKIFVDTNVRFFMKTI